MYLTSRLLMRYFIFSSFVLSLKSGLHFTFTKHLSLDWLHFKGPITTCGWWLPLHTAWFYLEGRNLSWLQCQTAHEGVSSSSWYLFFPF
jgi:hypothetical protein